MTVVINGTSGITDVNGTAAAPAITGTDTDTGVFFGTNTVSLSTGGTERLQVDSSGNLGLGVTPSAWDTFKALDVNTYTSLFSSTGSSQLSGNLYYASSAYKYKTTAAASIYVQTAGQHQWYNAPSGTAGTSATVTQAMTLDASGNLGIGTTSPSTRLHVAGGAGTEVRVTSSASLADGTGSAIVRFGGSNSATSGYVGYGGTANDYYAWNALSGNMIFGTANLERARIDSSGNLLVGTTSNGSNFKSVIQFAGSGTNGLYLLNNASSGSPTLLQISNTGYAPNNSDYSAAYSDSVAQRWVLRFNGGLSNYQANNTNLSDRREKTNFAPAKSYLGVICSIPVQTFNYIDQNLEEDGGLTLGVVAQDVQAVAPELVMESNWGTEDNPKMRLSIYQTDLQYALMKCIQEQQAIITKLQADVAALKGQA